MTVTVYSANILVKNLSANKVQASPKQLNKKLDYTSLSMNDNYDALNYDSDVKNDTLSMNNTFYRVTINGITVRFNIFKLKQPIDYFEFLQFYSIAKLE